MKKKYYLLMGTLLVFFLAVTAFWKMQNSHTIAASVLPVNKTQKLEDGLIFSEELQYQLFCNQVEVPYDALTGTHYLPQTAKGSWMREDAFTLSEDDLKLYWYEDSYWDNIEEAIAEGHAFSFFVTDGTRAKKGSMVFTGLPMLKVDRLEQLAEDSFYCKVTIYDPFHNQQELYENESCYGILSLRGKTSQMFPKKGWNLDLIKENGIPYKTSLFGLREDDDWKLNALYPDASKVREQVAMKLWKELAAGTESPYDAGTNIEYFELMLENDYHGIYGAMEQLDYKQFSLDKSEDVIYKGYAWPREGNTDRNVLEGAADYCGHLIKAGDRPIRPELWQPLVEYVDAAGFATEDLSCDEDVLYEYVKQHMDMDNLLNSELLVQLLYAFDNKYKNLYVNADIRDDGDYTLWKVPWDLNYSFGDRYSTEGVALTAYKLEWSQELMPEFMITETLLQAGNQEFAQLLNQKWKTLRETTFSIENIQRIAEESLGALVDSGAYARDEARWPEGPHDCTIEPILEFHNCRLQFLDEHYASFLNENE